MDFDFLKNLKEKFFPLKRQLTPEIELKGLGNIQTIKGNKRNKNWLVTAVENQKKRLIFINKAGKTTILGKADGLNFVFNPKKVQDIVFTNAVLNDTTVQKSRFGRKHKISSINITKEEKVTFSELIEIAKKENKNL